MNLHFDTCTLGDVTYGAECYDADEALRRPKYAVWYETRKNKVFSALAFVVNRGLQDDV